MAAYLRPSLYYDVNILNADIFMLSPGERNIRIAAAAQDAVRKFSHFSLGTGDIDRIIASTSHGTGTLDERIRVAQNMAQDTAAAYLAAQERRNITDDPTKPQNAGVYAFGGNIGLMAGGRWDVRGDPRTDSASTGSPNSGTYKREFGPAALNNSFNALLTEGYSKAQLSAVMPYARELGWHDKQGLRDLADAGKPFAGDAAAYHRAVKSGNTREAERLKKKMQDDYHRATPGSKKHRGMGNSLRRLHIDTKAELNSGHAPTQASPQAVPQASQAIKSEQQRKAAASASDFLSDTDNVWTKPNPVASTPKPPTTIAAEVDPKKSQPDAQKAQPKESEKTKVVKTSPPKGAPNSTPT